MFLRKFMVLPLVLVLALSILAAGCGGDDSTTKTTPTVPPPTTPAAATSATPTQPTTSAPASTTPVVTTPAAVTTTPPETQSSGANEIVTAIVEAKKGISTVKMAIEMNIGVETIGGDNPGKMTIVTKGTGACNLTERKMHSALTMEMNSPMMGKMALDSESYIVDGWTYIESQMPIMGSQWMKMKLTDEEWNKQSDFNELVSSAKTVKQVGTEVVNSITCDVIEIVPDDAVIDKWLKTQVDAQTTGMDITSVDLSKKYTKFVIKDYVAKDNRRLIKETIDVTFEVTPADIPDSTSKFDKVVYSFVGENVFSDFDKPVTITLPAEAVNAVEMSGK